MPKREYTRGMWDYAKGGVHTRHATRGVHARHVVGGACRRDGTRWDEEHDKCVPGTRWDEEHDKCVPARTKIPQSITLSFPRASITLPVTSLRWSINHTARHDLRCGGWLDTTQCRGATPQEDNRAAGHEGNRTRGQSCSTMERPPMLWPPMAHGAATVAAHGAITVAPCMDCHPGRNIPRRCRVMVVAATFKLPTHSSSEEPHHIARRPIPR